jgi:hypothetical protein
VDQDDLLDPESLERGQRPGQPGSAGAGLGDGQGDGQNQGATPPRKIVSMDELLATAFSRIVLGLLLFAGFGIGFWVGGVALHDPDTCWLLALGRYIVENHQIPATDPFSWTFAAQEAAGQHFILYQWLSEVIFYLATLPAGLVTLLLLCAVTISTAFLSIPMGIVVLREAPFVKSAWAVFLGMLAASFHTLARPEIFSYLLLALFLQNTHDARVSSLKGEKKIFPLIFVLAPLMVLWANMHTGFVAGLWVLFAVCVGSGLSLLFFKAPVKNLFVSAAVALVGCLVAALINPYGAGLYAYIPKLFNLPINKYIVELQPVIGEQLEIKTHFYPFILLCLIYLILMAREGMAFMRPPVPSASQAAEKAAVDAMAPPQYDRKLLACELLLCLICGSFAIYNGLVLGRVASFATLILVGEVIALLALSHQRKSSITILPGVPPKSRFWALLDSHSLDLWKAGGIYEMAIVALCAVAGVTLVCFRVSKPELPASTIVFKTPYKAIDYIRDHEPKGNLFNDQQFGDVLIYYLKGKPKVFVDTRFDMYGAKLVQEYYDIHECQPGWKELFDKRDIAWVFLVPDAPLAKALNKDAGWQTLYKDDRALILERKK